jgi:hypothetical protein
MNKVIEMRDFNKDDRAIKFSIEIGNFVIKKNRD